jgi:hypothetical protein
LAVTVEYRRRRRRRRRRKRRRRSRKGRGRRRRRRRRPGMLQIERVLSKVMTVYMTSKINLSSLGITTTQT